MIAKLNIGHSVTLVLVMDENDSELMIGNVRMIGEKCRSHFYSKENLWIKVIPSIPITDVVRDH